MNPYIRTTVLFFLAIGFAISGSTAVAARPGEQAAGDSVHTVAIASVGNELKYAQTEFTVAAGEKVHLTLENKATTPGISHNLVILTMGADSAAIQRVGIAALQAADADYIPKDDAILFHTPLAAPGKTVELTFDAPAEPGDYPYVCTFPGHFVTMRGVMHVI